MLTAAVAAAILAFTVPALAAEFAVEPAPDIEALFRGAQGWIGADGDFSVPLDAGRTLWLFSDTFVGRIEESKRAGATLINNSIAVQKGDRVTFHFGRSSDGAPKAFVLPPDGRGYYWLFAGTRDMGDLFFFLLRVESTGTGGAFGFRSFGLQLARVANPDDNPARWQIEHLEFPFCDYSSDGRIFFGSSVLRDGNCIYIYGGDGRKKDGASPNGMIVARVDAGKFADFGSWQFFGGGAWQDDFRRADSLCPGMPTEYSVTWQPALKKYVAVYTEGGIFGVISMRTAETPAGPWSEPVRLYECPDRLWHKGAFSYAAKAHPSLAAADELVISYATNSHDFSDLIADARLYWPRFIRVRFAPRR